MIHSRLGKHQAQRDGAVAFFDAHDSKTNQPNRHFVFLDNSMKLVHKPWGWSYDWYLDLIHIKYHSKSEIEIVDLFLDIIVEKNGPTYRMIDFNDFASALESDDLRVSTTEFANSLRGLQGFLDKYLHKGKDFPPSCIQRYL